jgi:hypothetical protein
MEAAFILRIKVTLYPKIQPTCRQWWCLFLQLFVILVAAIVTCLPVQRLAKGRYVLSYCFTIATTIIMVSLNADIAKVWAYWDVAPLFSDYTGDDKVRGRRSG